MAYAFESASPPPMTRRVFLFSHARTMSSLLCRILSDQENWQMHDYHFQSSFMEALDVIKQGPAPDMTANRCITYRSLVEQEYQSLLHIFDRASTKDQKIFVKNHTYHACLPHVAFDIPSTLYPAQRDERQQSLDNGIISAGNPTFFPDRLMLSWTPVILLRHPAVTFESWYCAEGEPDLASMRPIAETFTSYRLSRSIFDWYRNQSQGSCEDVCDPIVLDANDIIDRRDILEKFCRRVGMDPHRLRFEWDRASSTQTQKSSSREKRFLRSIWNSTGVDSSKTSRNLDMSEKEDEWNKRFGPETATFLITHVNEALTDYNYIMAAKLS